MVDLFDNKWRIEAIKEMGLSHRIEQGYHVIEGQGFCYKHTSLRCALARIGIALADHARPTSSLLTQSLHERFSAPPNPNLNGDEPMRPSGEDEGETSDFVLCDVHDRTFVKKGERCVLCVNEALCRTEGHLAPITGGHCERCDAYLGKEY